MFKDKPHYYVQNPARDDRSRLARGIDILLALIMLWLLAALSVGALSLPPLYSGILTLLLTVLGTALVTWYQIKKNKAHRLHRDIWYSARKCRENLQGLDTPTEFAGLIKDLLIANFPMKELKVLPPGGESTIDLSGYIRNRKVGVRCLNPGTEDHQTTTGEIKKFLAELKQAGFNSGIVVSTGSFSDEARRFARRMSGRAKIHLIDGYAVLRMAKRSGHPVFPDEKWPGEKESRISRLEMALSIKENVMASRKKAVYFVMLGIIFVAVASLQVGLLGSVYMTMGVINLFIGFTGLILPYLRKYELLPDRL